MRNLRTLERRLNAALKAREAEEASGDMVRCLLARMTPDERADFERVEPCDTDHDTYLGIRAELAWARGDGPEARRLRAGVPARWSELPPLERIQRLLTDQGASSRWQAVEAAKRRVMRGREKTPTAAGVGEAA